MHFRRLASLFLGAWLCGSFFMTWVATQNFRMVDEVLATPSPGAAADIAFLGKEPARMFLRHLVSEQNRHFFQTWELAQLALGTLLLICLFFGVDGRPSLMILTILMMCCVSLMHWWLTPEIVRIGRQIDFIPASTASALRDRFWSFHTAYSTTEVLKLMLGFALLVGLLRRSRRRGRRIDSDLDFIDHPDHGHVDR